MPFLLAACLSFANWCFALVCLPESLHERDSDHLIGSRTFSLTALMSPLKTMIGPLIMAYAVMILAFSQMEGSFSWVANDVFHFSENAIYAVFAYLGIVMTLVQGGLVRRLSAKVGDKPLVVSGMILMILGLGLLPLVVQSWWLWLMAGTLATGHSLSQPALLSTVSKASTDTTQGSTMGVCQSLASLSRFLGPLLAGLLYPVAHAMGVYGSAAFFMVIALGLSLNGFRHLNQQPVAS
jgi:DHA1 family tetracycline resistance protein-like MFS transporter